MVIFHSDTLGHQDRSEKPMGKLKKLFQGWGKHQTNDRIESNNQPHDVTSSHFFKATTTTGNVDTNTSTIDSTTKANESNFFHSDPKSILKWGLMLSKLPKLVNELMCVNPVHVDQLERTTLALVEFLSQMASKEIQIQLNQYYSYDPSTIGTAGIIRSTRTSNVSASIMLTSWEERKNLKQNRKSLLSVWKFVLTQLNSTIKNVTPEVEEMFHQLLLLLVERVEFQLPQEESVNKIQEDNKMCASFRRQSVSLSLSTSSSHASSLSKTMQTMARLGVTPLTQGILFDENDADQYNTHTNRNTKGQSQVSSTASQDSELMMELEKDLFLYRCLLVGTFKYVVDVMENVHVNKLRSRLTLKETRLFTRLLSACFIRIPFVQKQVLNALYDSFLIKKWSHTMSTCKQTSTQNKWMGPSFHESLSSWKTFGKKILDQEQDSTNNQEDNDTSSTESSRKSSRERSSSRRSSSSTSVDQQQQEQQQQQDDQEEQELLRSTTSSSSSSSSCSSTKSWTNEEKQFKQQNPTLFAWKTRYVPYLGKDYEDQQVFACCQEKQAWVQMLTKDGEMLSLFITGFVKSVSQCILFSNKMDHVVSCLPGFHLLIRINLLLIREAMYQQYQSLQEFMDPTKLIGEQFGLTKRGVKTVLTESRILLELMSSWSCSKEIETSCLLGILDCTNVFDPKSVGLCLNQLEIWISLTNKSNHTSLYFEKDSTQVFTNGPSVSNQRGLFMENQKSTSILMAAIRIFLSSERFDILNRVLIFLYQKMDFFLQDDLLRQNLLKILVQKHMVLFLHWHHEVRNHYHHLLVYRIATIDRIRLDSFMDMLLIGGTGTDTGTGTGTGSASGSSSSSSSSQQDQTLNKPSSRSNMNSREERIHCRTEKALWRAFDACLAMICTHEREFARESTRQFQQQIEAAKCRYQAFQRLHRHLNNEDSSSSNSNTINETIPGGFQKKNCLHEVENVEQEIVRDPPPYLRYLPAEEAASLQELKNLARSLQYPKKLQVYAAISLRSYGDLLKTYYTEWYERKGMVDIPPLGFC